MEGTDNRSFTFKIKVAPNPVFHARTKHIKLDVNSIRDLRLGSQATTTGGTRSPTSVLFRSARVGHLSENDPISSCGLGQIRVNLIQ